MKRRIVTLLLVLSIATISITACGNKTSDNTEAVVVEPSTETVAVTQIESLPWLQLASLETHPELRSAFEDLLGITTEDDGTKNGIVYTDENGDVNQNNTLFNALGNTNFTISYIRDAEQISKIEEIANAEYTDLEDNQGVAAVINAYFELLPDQADGQFDGSATISRAQAMTLLMRATTPVSVVKGSELEGSPVEDADFTAAVGESQYTNFAAPMNQYSYLNTENSLTEQTFNTTMSRGEYIYMLTNTIFDDKYTEMLAAVGKTDESLAEDVSLTTVKDGGNITFQEALNNPENGLPTEMYKTLARAVALGFITEDDLNWDEAITKSDAITIFIDATEVYQSNIKEVRNDIGLGETPPYEVVDQGDYPDTRSDHQEAWDNFKENWNESDYGTTTAGKTANDFPYYGDTGYDPNGTILQYRTTDKGYTVFYDTNTGRVYYSGMMLPTGSFWQDRESGGVLSTYAYNKGYNSLFDITYAEMQELLGVYNGD